MTSLRHLTELYSDTEQGHRAVWDACLRRVEQFSYLRDHRDYVEKGLYGYGERPFHAMWDVLVGSLPGGFSFLEVGVFQGQVLSLVQLCAKQYASRAKIVGVTPLDTTGDHCGEHPSLDYAARIAQIHREFGLSAPMILKGLSFDPRVQQVAREEGPYDLVFIDGCHDYPVVVDDIEVYSAMVKTGGYLVLDDAASFLNIPDGMINMNWRGIPQVSEAVRDCLESNPAWEHVLAVGHNRVFRRRA
jgi:hypothetical protein